MRRTVALILTLAVPLSLACSLSGPLADHAVSYNRTVEQAHNEALFLNVLRARHRMPMHFTSIGSVTASLSWTAGAKAEYSETEEIRKDALTLGSTLSVTGSPTVQVSVLDTQEFVRGTLAPVQPELLVYLAQQGWKLDLLLHMLVERLEVPDGLECSVANPGDVLTNNPEDLKDASKFNQCVAEWTALPCTVQLSNVRKAVTETVHSQLTVKDLLRAVKQEVWLEVDPDLAACCAKAENTDQEACTEHEIEQCGEADSVADNCEDCVPIQLQKNATRLALSCPVKEVDERPASAREDDQVSVFITDPREMMEQSEKREEIAREGEDVDQGAREMVLRSPQGVLFYLGEVVAAWGRAEADGKYNTHIPLIQQTDAEGALPCPYPRLEAVDGADPDFCTPLLVVRNKKDCNKGPALVKAEYLGETFKIPKGVGLKYDVLDSSFCGPGRSMQALSLASSLIALQKSAKDIPSPALVQLVGQ